MRRHASFNARCNRMAWWGAALNTLLLLWVLWLLLGDCGVGRPAPAGYVLSLPSQLSYLTWTQASSGSAVTGLWSQVSQESYSRDPVTLSFGFVGTLANSGVALTIGGATLTTRLRGQDLQVAATDATGAMHTQTWYGVSQSDYNAEATAFTAETHLSFDLAAMAFTVAHPPFDSDARSYDNAVQTAWQYDQNLQTQDERISASLDPCSATGIFDQLYPPGDALFRLAPYAIPEQAISHTTLGAPQVHVRADWQAAQANPPPSVPGLPLPWVISQNTEARGEQQAMAMEAALLATFRNDYTKMSALKQQAQQTGSQVEQIKRAHGCP
jgi:hypothetical protein